jgi:hypothetical protein
MTLYSALAELNDVQITPSTLRVWTAQNSRNTAIGDTKMPAFYISFSMNYHFKSDLENKFVSSIVPCLVLSFSQVLFPLYILSSTQAALLYYGQSGVA